MFSVGHNTNITTPSLPSLLQVLRLVLDQKVHNVTKRAAVEEEQEVTTEALTEALTEATTELMEDDEGATTIIPLLEDDER